MHTTVAIRLALCALLGLIAALVDLLAVVGRRGALAGVPLLVVFTISGAVPRKPVSWFWFALSAAGFLILLALDSSDDLQRWGHYVPRPDRAPGGARRSGVGPAHRRRGDRRSPSCCRSSSRPTRATSSPTCSTPQHGTATRLRRRPEHGGSGTGGIDPFAALRGQLNRDKTVDLLTVSESSDDPQFGTAKGRPAVLPAHERAAGLHRRRLAARASRRPAEPRPTPSTTARRAPRSTRTSSQFSATDHRHRPALEPAGVRLPDGDGRAGQLDQVELAGPAARRLAGHRRPDDPGGRRPARPDRGRSRRRPTASDPAMTSWLKLPADLAFVRNLTARSSRNANTPYARGTRDQRLLRQPGERLLLQPADAPKGDSGDDLTDFLKNRVGYCQQYAAAMGVMLRLAGVPARVVLGYAHDVPDSSGTFTVTTYDAHAWVEAYFAGIGWVPFDPTPIDRHLGRLDERSGLGAAQQAAAGPAATDNRRFAAAAIAGPRRDAPAPAACRRAASTQPGCHVSWLVVLRSSLRGGRRRAAHPRLRALATPTTSASARPATAIPTRCGPSCPPPRPTSATSGRPRARRARSPPGWAARRGTADSSLATLTTAVEHARYAPGRQRLGAGIGARPGRGRGRPALAAHGDASGSAPRSGRRR